LETGIDLQSELLALAAPPLPLTRLLT